MTVSSFDNRCTDVVKVHYLYINLMKEKNMVRGGEGFSQNNEILQKLIKDSIFLWFLISFRINLQAIALKFEFANWNLIFKK